jgi:hypothetical protein
MYQIYKDPTKKSEAGIKRLTDNAFIPMDEANTDYQAYLKFLEEGGQPLPADEGEA